MRLRQHLKREYLPFSAHIPLTPINLSLIPVSVRCREAIAETQNSVIALTISIYVVPYLSQYEYLTKYAS